MDLQDFLYGIMTSDGETHIVPQFSFPRQIKQARGISEGEQFVEFTYQPRVGYDYWNTKEYVFQTRTANPESWYYDNKYSAIKVAQATLDNTIITGEYDLILNKTVIVKDANVGMFYNCNIIEICDSNIDSIRNSEILLTRNSKIKNATMSNFQTILNSKIITLNKSIIDEIIMSSIESIKDSRILAIPRFCDIPGLEKNRWI